MQTCSKCNQLKPLSKFVKEPANRSGYASYCTECRNKRTRELNPPLCNQVSSTETFIEKSKTKYLDKFTYKNTSYTKAIEPITLHCTLHNIDFTLKEARGHFKNSTGGCPICNKELRTIGQRKPQNKFIAEAIQKHKGIYDYSKTNYVNDSTHVTVICKYHGEFSVQAGAHIGVKPIGCAKCSAIENSGWGSSRYKDHPTLLYILDLGNSLYKVGITKTGSVIQRYGKKQYNDVIKSIIYQVTCLDGYDAYKLEKEILRRFRAFSFTGKSPLYKTNNTEIITTNPINSIQQIIKDYYAT